MTSSLEILSAACVALRAVAFANVARAEDAPAKPDAMAADHMSGDHMERMKKPHMKKHMMKEGGRVMDGDAEVIHASRARGRLRANKGAGGLRDTERTRARGRA